MMVAVKRLFQGGIIVLLLLAIFGVLLTPDPGDDPTGIVARLEKGRAFVTLLPVAHTVPLLLLTAPCLAVFFRPLSPKMIAKLDLICTRLC
jgi:hypothetical protein